MQILALLLIFALIGGGIYFWVRRERSKLLAKRTKLAEDAGLLDSSGKLSSAAFDRIVGEAKATDLDQPDSEDNGTNEDNGNNDVEALAAVVQAESENNSTTATNETGHAKFQAAAPSIVALCEQLLLAWSESTKAYQEQEKAARTRSNILDHMRYRHRRSIHKAPAQRSAEIENLRVMHKGLRAAGNEMAVAYENFINLPAAAKAAWNALTSALTPFSESYVQTLPPQLAAIGLSAYQLKSVSKGSIEKLLEELSELNSQSTTIRSYAIAPLAQCSDEQRSTLHTAATEAAQDLRARISAVIETLLIAEKNVGEVSIANSDLEELHQTRFTPPQKPTPEEVMRYLMAVEDWTISVASAQRDTLAKTARAVQSIAEAKTSLAEYQGAYQVQSKKLMATQSEDDIALALALQTVSEDITAALAGCEKTLHEQQQKISFKAIAEVVAQTPADQELIKTLRLSARTVGFALAQANVAGKKLRQLAADRPDDQPSPPKVDRFETFVTHMGLYSQYLKKVEKFKGSVKIADAEIELVQIALAARQEKVRETVKVMSLAGAAAVKSFSRTTCDELRVVVGMIEKIAQLNKT